MVKLSVNIRPFDAKKVKPVSFKKIVLPCDACSLAKSTRAVFNLKVMTNLAVGFVRKTDING